jgi:cobaltochelatase CobS
MSSPDHPQDEKGQKVDCKICGLWYHRLDVHLKKHNINTADYVKKYPGASTISLAAKNRASSAQAQRAMAKAQSAAAEAVEKQATTALMTGVIEESKKLDNVYKIGVARLFPRTNLTSIDEKYVPKSNPNWKFDDRIMEDWEYLAIAIEDNEPVYIGGPTGCGKSASVLELASHLNQPVLRVQLNRDFRVGQFVGRSELKIDDDGNRYTEFEHGVLPQAIQNGWWLLLDEVDQAHPDVIMALQSVLEGNPLVLTENFGEVIDPKATERSQNFRIIATANTLGHGDDTGLYTGAKVQNEATMDRYAITIKADYPAAKTEVAILTQAAKVTYEDAKKMVKVAKTVRKSLKNEECNCTFSTRRLINWAKKSKRLNNVARAAKIVVLNKLDDEDSIFVADIVQRYFGSRGAQL